MRLRSVCSGSFYCGLDGGEGRNGVADGDAMIEVSNLLDTAVNDDRKSVMVHVMVNLWPFGQVPFVAVDCDGLCFVLFHPRQSSEWRSAFKTIFKLFSASR